MPPYPEEVDTNHIFEEDISHEESKPALKPLVAPQADNRKPEIVPLNLITFGYGHLAAIYGIYLCFTSAKWATIVFAFVLYICAELGITAGAHRLWSHRSYKAKLPLRLILLLFNTLAFQNTAIDWVRDHRMHHKYSDTDADPHNATRGFFFSHVGWLLTRKHPEVKRRGKDIDMMDIYNDSLLKFQKKYAIPFVGLVCFVIPTLMPMYFWNETLNNSWHIATMLRYIVNLNMTFLVNSAAHIWGYKPYDKSIKPVQNITVSILILGEGFHNYHHVFPWDYRTSELGNDFLNFTTLFINLFAKIGWAYDLKTASDKVVAARRKRTGDGTNLWGWEDKSLNEEERQAATVLYPNKYLNLKD
uniref:Acyl-CoA-delta11-desaturase n=1 Tax=Lampronia capitella TaxID=485574 RepID=B6CBS5_9NEOP|nr:acyl-CoA-delta11-desaturase [Lampronia capitella]